jgi:hypothetical protein
MKVRIKGNSVRYRLAKSEVRKLKDEGIVEESTHFPGQVKFSYVLQADDSVDALTADFSDNRMTIRIPAREAQVWYDSNRVGYNGGLPIDNGEHLSLLVEKDFQCLDETHEDQTDNYPNPLAQKE